MTQDPSEIMRQAGVFAQQGAMDKALALWVEAARLDVPEAYLNISVLYGQECAKSDDLPTKQSYCKQLAGFLSQNVVLKFRIADLPLNAAVMLADTAAFMRERGEPAESVYNYYYTAAHYYQLAAQMPEAVDATAPATALNGLACLLLRGDGVDKQPERAYNYFLNAAQNAEFGEAMFNLGICHYKEWGCPPAPREEQLKAATEWFKLAHHFIPDNYRHPDLKEMSALAASLVQQEIEHPHTPQAQKIGPAFLKLSR